MIRYFPLFFPFSFGFPLLTCCFAADSSMFCAGGEPGYDRWAANFFLLAWEHANVIKLLKHFFDGELCWFIVKLCRVMNSVKPVGFCELFKEIFLVFWQISRRIFFCSLNFPLHSCNGDSGGAMVIFLISLFSRRFFTANISLKVADGVLVGIVSTGATTCGISYPGVYTNVTHPSIRAFIRHRTGVWELWEEESLVSNNITEPLGAKDNKNVFLKLFCCLLVFVRR